MAATRFMGASSSSNSSSAMRAENQFRLAFIISNIGAFGNLRHQEKIF